MILLLNNLAGSTNIIDMMNWQVVVFAMIIATA
jgi:hypothetical protein